MEVQERRTGQDAQHSQEVVVGLFDILGFRDRVKEAKLDELGRKYYELLQLKKLASRIPELRSDGVAQWVSPSAVFSDTILFWANAERDSVDVFLTTCSVLIAEALETGWPLRGAIAVGPCIVDRKTRMFIGQPIIDAYRLEKAQNWIGAAVHRKCVDHPEVGDPIVSNQNVVKHSPPLKSDYPCRPVEYSIEWASRTIEWDNALEYMKLEAESKHSSKYEAALNFAEKTRSKLKMD